MTMTPTPNVPSDVRVFVVMAERVRAGEPWRDVLADYDFGVLTEQARDDIPWLLAALTEQAREIDQATWEAAAQSLDRAAIATETHPLFVDPDMTETMRLFSNAMKDILEKLAVQFRGRAHARGGTG